MSLDGTRGTWTMLALGIALAGCNASHGRGDDAGVTGDDAGVTEDGGDVTVDAGDCVLPEPENHRAAEATCSMERPSDPLPEPLPDWSECDSHDDCTEGTNGRCTGNSHHGYTCTYDRCFADADCSGDTAGPCLCRGDGGGVGTGGANRCAAGDCQTDADCGPGGWCSPSLGECGDYGGVRGYYCHTCEDECTDDSDCTEMEGTFGPGYCAYDSAVGHWRCSYQHCAG